MKLGEYPTSAGDMDAIHVPVISVTSDDLIRPGDPVRFVAAGKVQLCEKAESDGLADPWGKIARPGQFFWCCVNPQQIEGALTHKFNFKPKVPL